MGFLEKVRTDEGAQGNVQASHVQAQNVVQGPEYPQGTQVLRWLCIGKSILTAKVPIKKGCVKMEIEYIIYKTEFKMNVNVEIRPFTHNNKVTDSFQIYILQDTVM